MLKFLYGKRPLSGRFFFVILSINFCGCSRIQSFLIKENLIVKNSEIPGISNEDFVDHFLHLGILLQNNKRIRFKAIKRSSRHYLEKIFNKIISNNELLLVRSYKPQFNVIIDKAPYIFSLPNYRFYFSTGLMRKYFKNEALLVKCFCF